MSVQFTLDSHYWDSTQNSGAREIFRSNDRFPLDIVACDGPEYIPHYRPIDIPQWRENLIDLFRDEPSILAMWITAMDEFEEDSTLYFTVTY